MNLKYSDSQNFASHLTHPVFEEIKSMCSPDEKIFVIGGYVRDLLLKRPSKDIDIVIEGSGIKLAQKLAEHLNIKQVNVFKNFGTAMLKIQNYEIEFVGARKESYQRNSRKPIVEDGSIKDDQLRRDFTINALAISINKNSFGKLIDPFEGIKALKNKIIVTPLNPDITFSDDPLRMMRAVRFASQLNFSIHPESFEAIKRNCQRIKIISQERITDEFNKIMLSPKPSVGLSLLFESGLLKLIFPELHALQGIEKINGKKHKDNFYHTLEVTDNISINTSNLWLRWAALLHDIAKAPTKRFDSNIGWTFHGHEVLGSKMVPKIFRKFKLPTGKEMRYVRKLVFLHLRPIALTNEVATDSAIRRLLIEAGEDLEDLMTLCRADITSKNPQKVNKYLKQFEEVEEKLKDVEERDKIRDFQPPISGEMIMDFFNIKPSYEVGVIKNSIKEAILEGEIKNDYNQALDFMKRKGEELGLKTTNIE